MKHSEQLCFTKQRFNLFFFFPREEINKLRNEHEDGLTRLRKTKDLEIEAISSSQSHTKYVIYHLKDLVLSVTFLLDL